MPAVKRSKRSKPSKRLFGTPNPAGKGTKAHISIAFYWRSSLLFASRQTLTPFWHPQPRRQRHQGPYINSVLLAFKPAVCQPSNAPNAPNPPNAFLAPPTPQAKAPRPIDQLLFIGVQACRLPAIKRSKPSKRLFGTPNPAGKGTKAHISIAFYWRSSLLFTSRQTLTPFWHPQPRRQRHQGPYINSVLLAFKPAVCQPSNAPNAPNPPNAFLAPPTPQAKAPRPIDQLLFIGVQACRLPAIKRSKPSKRLFGTPNPAGKGTKAHISIAFYWRSSKHGEPKNVSFPWVSYCRAFRIHVTSLITSYLHDFLSVQHAVSLPPSEALPKLFPRFCYVQHAVSPPPSEALRKHFRPISRPQPSAQPSSLITSGFFSPPISNFSLAPTPSAAVRAVLRTHLPSAAVRAAKVAHHQRLLLPTHFQPLRCTHAVRSRPRSSPHPFAARSRPRSQARSSPAASSPHPFPATPLHPRRPQPSAQPRSLITSGFFSPPISSHPLAPTPSAAVRAVLRTHLPSAAVRAAKLAHHQRLLLPTHFQPLPCTHAVRSRPRSSPHPFAVRSRPRSQARSSPAASSPHPFPATPLHPRRPQPSAQPRSLITSGFFSPPISSHPLAPTPSAAVRAVLRTHLPSAAVRAAKLAHHQRLLLPTHFQPLRCTHAVRSRPRSSPHPFPVRSRPRSQARSSPAASSPHPFPATPLHPGRPQPSAQFSAPICRPQPSAQPRSLITSGFFSPPISSHSVAPTPSAAVHAVLRTHLPSAAVRAAKLAHHQRLPLPTHFQPLRCTHAVRSRPRSSPHPFAVRSRPRSQGRSSPAASSPHPFPATPLHPRRLQPSAQFSAPICRPQPSAQPRSLITSGFFSPPISSHPLAPTPSAAVHAVLRTHLPSAAVRAAKVAHHQRLLLSTHFQPPPCTHAVRSRPRSSPHPFAVRSRPRSQGRSSPAASSPHPFPATPLHPRHPQPSTHFSAPIPRPQPSAQPSSLITSGFFSPPISSHSLAPRPSAAVRSIPFPSFPILFRSFPILSLPFRSFPILSLPFPSFPFLSLPFPSLFLPFPSFPFLSLPVPSFPFLSLPFPSFPFLSLLPTHF